MISIISGKFIIILIIICICRVIKRSNNNRIEEDYKDDKDDEDNKEKWKNKISKEFRIKKHHFFNIFKILK